MEQRYGLGLDRGVLASLELLDGLLVRWGRAVALSGFSHCGERVDRYFAEALLTARRLPDRGVAVDVGSGGGSPALPLAIVHPEIEWTLLEPNRRKAVFLDEAVHALGLQNVRVARKRLEQYRPEGVVDVVTSRGLALGRESIRVMAGWLSGEGRLIFLTGRRVSERIAQIAVGQLRMRVERREPLPTKAQPWLIVLTRSRDRR